MIYDKEPLLGIKMMKLHNKMAVVRLFLENDGMKT